MGATERSDALAMITLMAIVSLLSPAASPGQSAAAISPGDIVARWTPESPMEGTLFAIVVEGGPAEGVEGNFAGQPLHFEQRDSGSLVAMAAAPLDSVGERRLRLRFASGGETTREYLIPIAAGTYAMQRLTVAPEYGSPQPPEIQRRIEAEAARALEVSRRSHDTPRMWEPPFVAPRTSRITSGFGHGRTFNGRVQSRHTGTDYAGAVGTPVLAPARGRVAIVDEFYLGGKVVYIDHGAGLVTAYLHLSEQLVSPGAMVEPGDTIARIGATGRVTGPHLHWIVRYGPHSVDGESLLRFSTPSRP